MRNPILLFCVLIAFAAIATAQSIPTCGSYGPPSGFNYGVSIAETSNFWITTTPAYEEYGCILPFSPVIGGYLVIYEDPGYNAISDYVWFTNEVGPTGGPRAVMYMYSEVEGVALSPPANDAHVVEIGPEGANYAIYNVTGDVQYTIYSDVPEPGSLLLAGAALLGLGLLKRKLA